MSLCGRLEKPRELDREGVAITARRAEHDPRRTGGRATPERSPSSRSRPSRSSSRPRPSARDAAGCRLRSPEARPEAQLEPTRRAVSRPSMSTSRPSSNRSVWTRKNARLCCDASRVSGGPDSRAIARRPRAAARARRRSRRGRPGRRPRTIRSFASPSCEPVASERRDRFGAQFRATRGSDRSASARTPARRRPSPARRVGGVAGMSSWRVGSRRSSSGSRR